MEKYVTEVPEFWKSELPDIDRVMAQVKKGKVSIGCKSAGGRNVYMVEYGKRNDNKRTSNLSSSISAGDTKYYADKTSPETIPCIMLIACVHGGEFEGTVALLNLINLLETGKDFAGNKNETLSKMAEEANLLIVPCVNPDGRARVDAKSVVGMEYEMFRHYNQGTWKDGSLCGYPDCKKIHPIRESAGFLGGYFNDNGVNIQHDVYLPTADETKFLIKMAEEYAPDVIINAHGATCNAGHIIKGKGIYTPTMEELIDGFMENVKNTANGAGLPFVIPKGRNNPKALYYRFNLNTALFLTSGAITLTFESNQGVINVPGYAERGEDIYLSHEEIYETYILLFEETYKFAVNLCEGRKR